METNSSQTDSLPVPTEEPKIPHCDNTLRSAFVTCHRKFYFLHRLHLRSLYGSSALRYGSVWHAGMEHFYLHIKEFGWLKDGGAMKAGIEGMRQEWEAITAAEMFYDDYRTLENCMQSFLYYMNEFSADEGHMKVVQAEKAFRIRMAPETEEEERNFKGLIPFDFTGKVDLEVELNGRLWVNEHKTTGQPIDLQATRLNRSAQVMGYTYATIKKALDDSRKPDGALITIHHLSARKSTAKGNEGNYGTPKIEFRRVPQIFNDNDLLQWRNSFLATALDIQREDERGLWPMNHDSCFNYNTPCQFLGLCQNNESVKDIRIDESRYRVGEAWEVSKDVKASEVVF